MNDEKKKSMIRPTYETLKKQIIKTLKMMNNL